MVVYFNNYSVSFVNSASSSSLSVGFYDESCPRVEDIIYEELVKKMSQIPRNITIPGTLRLFFHDCYVQLYIYDNNSERNTSINLSLAGDAFDIVDKAKAALEKECPGVVSCSDILAILARDVVHWWEGPHWEVEKGRRDGLISNATEAQLLMPKSDENITTLIRGFKSIGLSTADLVTLSGAHTIGFTHCIEFASRIFHNDTTLNSTIREKVILSCPFPKIDRNVAEALDQTSEFVFDNKFYKSLRQRKGLLLTDHVLAFGENDVSRKLVYRYSEDQELFFQEFAKAMVKLGRVGVKTGNEGQIRRDCKKFN
ncbi:hypothetical protein C5167_042549 [Papaver somniferum]|uniref:Peroxidase n=1 Tax=Papaver somniferum TaxID=3469 RepID=A0A4Y7L6B7_PAPSO|nr:hypothetical protein C5167_042549 [Papaver somniferum]